MRAPIPVRFENTARAPPSRSSSMMTGPIPPVWRKNSKRPLPRTTRSRVLSFSRTATRRSSRKSPATKTSIISPLPTSATAQTATARACSTPSRSTRTPRTPFSCTKNAGLSRTSSMWTPKNSATLMPQSRECSSSAREMCWRYRPGRAHALPKNHGSCSSSRRR